MSVTFLHTADWQLGKPFAGVEDTHKRALLQNERFSAIRRIGGGAAREHGAKFVVVAGDLFDSPSATRSTVSAACSAIGSIGVPVFVIPGNHDHGGPGSLWEQDFFVQERAALAPNLKVLLERQPFELPDAVLFPCPLLRRHEPIDPTTWLRSGVATANLFPGKPRIVIAHGSVLNFGSMPDEEEPAEASNLLELAQLPENTFDYIALGDWHGAKDVGSNAWYSGTPESDRFLKGGEHDPGNILVVEATRGNAPCVQRLRTGAFGWHELDCTIADDGALTQLAEQVETVLGTRVNQDLLRLNLSGSLGIEASAKLEQLLETWKARLIRLKLDSKITLAPTAEEIGGLRLRASDPLLCRVAEKLGTLAIAGGEQGAIAQIALRELYAATKTF